MNQRLKARVQRKSSKPMSVQAAIIAKSMNGDSKTQIANDLDISRSTVYSVLGAHEIEQLVLEGRSKCIKMIPRSVRVIGDRLAKGSETAALAILRGTQVLQNQAVQVNVQNNGAMAWMTINQQKVEMAENVQDCPQADTEAKSDKP